MAISGAPSPNLGAKALATRTGFDAVSFLTVYAILLYAIPSGLRVTALGSAGSPALLWGVLGFLWWCSERLRHRRALTWDLSPAAVAMFAFALAAALSYIVAMTRGVPEVEGNTADTGIIRVAAWAGVLLVASDGIADWSRFLALLRRLVLLAGLLGALGLAQFVTGEPLIDWISLPGLSSDGSINIQGRSGFTRPAGTAVHPLEFGVVMCMVLPIALTLALHEAKRSWTSRWVPVAMIVGSSVLSVSRSALIGLAAGILVLAPTWPTRVRRGALIASIGVGVLVFVAVPGMVGTIRGLFLGIGEDDSTTSRTATYGLAFSIAGRFPVLGKGLGTFVPAYQILDNAFLLLLIELGLVGSITFLGMLTVGFLGGSRGRQHHPVGRRRDLGQALIASVVAGSLLFLFFDGLSFSMAAGTLFLFLGLCGAYWRLSTAPNADPMSLPASDGAGTGDQGPVL